MFLFAFDLLELNGQDLRCLADTDSCLAQSNESRTGGKATKKQNPQERRNAAMADETGRSKSQ